MATQLLRKDPKSKQNWMRMLKAANQLNFEDGRLVAAKGWRIDDMDVDSISTKLKELEIDHEVKDRYTILIH
jgi:hypothetical protein